MQIGNQELLLTMKKFSSPYEYLKLEYDLNNDYYEYYIAGQHLNLYTHFENKECWVKVVTVGNNQAHMNEDAVDDVKVSDEIINILRTDTFTYSMMAEVEEYQRPYNEWLSYPFRMYVHNSMEHFSSITPAIEIKNSNLVSVDINMPPVNISQNYNTTIGFGDMTCGDTFFGYGGKNMNGFTQSFSGSGSGSVYVR